MCPFSTERKEMRTEEPKLDKGTERQQEITTVQLYWELLTKQPAPHFKYIVGWLRTAPLDEVMSQIEHVQHIVRKGTVSADAAGRMISANLRNRREQLLGVGVLRF